MLALQMLVHKLVQRTWLYIKGDVLVHGQPRVLQTGHVLRDDEQLYFTVALVLTRGADESKEVFKVH